MPHDAHGHKFYVPAALTVSHGDSNLALRETIVQPVPLIQIVSSFFIEVAVHAAVPVIIKIRL